MILHIVHLKVDATGEGSRGGHVIGHTSSGKPIYMSHSHGGHQGFDAKDHGQAANLHLRLMLKHSSIHNKNAKQADHHEEQMKKHGASQRQIENTRKRPVTPQVPPPGAK